MSLFFYLACDRHHVRMAEPLTVCHTRGFDSDGRDEPPRGAITVFVQAHRGCVGEAQEPMMVVRTEGEIETYECEPSTDR